MPWPNNYHNDRRPEPAAHEAAKGRFSDHHRPAQWHRHHRQHRRRRPSPAKMWAEAPAGLSGGGGGGFASALGAEGPSLREWLGRFIAGDDARRLRRALRAQGDNLHHNVEMRTLHTPRAAACPTSLFPTFPRFPL